MDENAWLHIVTEKTTDTALNILLQAASGAAPVLGIFYPAGLAEASFSCRDHKSSQTGMRRLIRRLPDQHGLKIVAAAIAAP